MKKDENNEIIAGGNAENENAAMKTAQELLDDDWDEDRIPIARTSEQINKHAELCRTLAFQAFQNFQNFQAVLEELK